MLAVTFLVSFLSVCAFYAYVFVQLERENKRLRDHKKHLPEHLYEMRLERTPGEEKDAGRKRKRGDDGNVQIRDAERVAGRSMRPVSSAHADYVLRANPERSDKSGNERGGTSDASRDSERRDTDGSTDSFRHHSGRSWRSSAIA